MAQLPKVAFLITTYQHERFVREAVRAGLQQTWPSLDLVVCDDASTDDTWREILIEVEGYRGPHRLVLHRQSANIGPGPNTEFAMGLTDAEFIVRSHGDDISMRDRVGRLVQVWRQTGARMIAHNALRGEDPKGVTRQMVAQGATKSFSAKELAQQGWVPEMLGSTFSWHRSLFDEFGWLDPTRLVRGGDHVLPFRAALMGGFRYVHEALVFWRAHHGQMTLKTADFHGDNLHKGETMRAYDFAAQVQRRVDLEGFAKRHGWNDDLREVRSALISTMGNIGAQWTSARLTLENKGEHIRWAPTRVGASLRQ